MANEEKVVADLSAQFEFLANQSRIQRERRIFTDVPLEHIGTVINFIAQELEFRILGAISGLDQGENIGVIYHFARFDGTMLNLKTQLPKSAPILKSITADFPPAALFERELVDLLGVEVTGLPAEASRYPLPDNWPAGEYPLRKDWQEKQPESKPEEK